MRATIRAKVVPIHRYNLGFTRQQYKQTPNKKNPYIKNSVHIPGSVADSVTFPNSSRGQKSKTNGKVLKKSALPRPCGKIGGFSGRTRRIPRAITYAVTN